MAAELSRIAKALSLVDAYIKTMWNVHPDRKDEPIPEFEVRLVWFCYILGGWKALVSTDLKDDIYYEITYNVVKKETYLDAYEKVHNVCFPD